MEPLDCYLLAVKRFLPESQQGDILNELSENLRAEREDKAAELGRPLNEEEQKAWLMQHGHPMLVAGHYQPSQIGLAFGRQLIGPALFPVYLRVLWFNLGISFAIFLLRF